MAFSGSVTISEIATESRTIFFEAEADAARDLLFNKILDQLSEASLFSNSSRAPNVFIVYAHDNEKEGAAYDGCVREIITWLRKIHVRILSDQSPLPPLKRRLEGDDAIRNILANQLCLLPPESDGSGMTTVTTVDKIIVCGSKVLERYYSKPSALSYIRDIVRICTTGVDLSTNALHPMIRARVETESNKGDFHHIFTELAFLEVRKAVLPQAHGMVPVVLSQTDADGAPMPYLPMFDNTDLKLKLQCPAESSLHKLFFKLLEQLFPDDRDFIRPFRDCYNSVSSMLQTKDGAPLSWQQFDNILNQQITKAYQEYWSLSCVLVRDGKLQAYSGKLGNQVSRILEETELGTKHQILKWLSPTPAAEYHGRFQDSGTARMEGTCDWVIKDENFHQWHASNGSRLLLLCGDMGTGKTYSTSRVVDWIKQGLSSNSNHEAFAYFYCNRQDPMRRKPKEILRNIIRQMATGPWREEGKGKTVHKTVFQLWKRSQDQGISSTFAQWSTCLLELIDSYPRTTIVLDAFDECEKEQQQDLMKLFDALAARDSEAKPVKLFVSTRPEEEILQYFDKYPAIWINEKHNTNDIASFVRTKIADHSRWSKMPENFQADVIQTLLQKSGTMFLFASLQIEHLLLCRTQPAFKDRLGKLPRSLEKTYEEIYQNATSHPDERKLLNRAIRWVTFSARPLSTNELLLAICQDSESDGLTEQRQDVDEGLILALGRNLLYLEGGSNDKLENDLDFENDIDSTKYEATSGPVWRLEHQAVGEFFGNSEYCNADLAHYEIGKVCLMVLLNAFNGEPAQPRSNPEDDVSGTGEYFERTYERYGTYHRKERNILAEYATWAWPTHVRAQEHREACSIAGLSKKLQKFLGEPEECSGIYERWTEHAFAFVYRPPSWSVFATRAMPRFVEAERIMKPISLACYLGFYTSLADWWDQRRFDLNFVKFEQRDWNPWEPFSLTSIYDSNLPLRWSLVALACANDNAEILKRLLDRGAHINTIEEDEMPPIFVATLSNSTGVLKELLHRGSESCSSFKRSHGHILHFAISQSSLTLAELLLLRVFNDPREVEGILTRFSSERLLSAYAIVLLVDMGVNVNTPLLNGTLLSVAARRGWKILVRRLLDDGVDVNTQFNGGNSRSALEAALSASDSSTARLLVEHGAHVTPWALALASRRSVDGGGVLQLLLMRSPDLNETWTDNNGDNTSALIEIIKFGEVDSACLLIQHGADANLKVGGQYGDPLTTVFWATVADYRDKSPFFEYPTAAMIKVLIEAGASLDELENDHLNRALAAAAYAGLEDMVECVLARGACPNAFCAHRWTTALGAATASRHPRASYIIHVLIHHGANVNAYFPDSVDRRWPMDRLVLDHAFSLLLINDHDELLDNWLRSVSALLSKGAVWDIDFVQWRNCLEFKAPYFASRNAKSLDQILQRLKSNRHNLFLRDPGAGSDERWKIKTTGDPSSKTRGVLRTMRDFDAIITLEDLESDQNLEDVDSDQTLQDLDSDQSIVDLDSDQSFVDILEEGA